MSADPNGTRWSTSDRNVGKKMLQQGGWEEGTGLGKQKDGVMAHVKVVKKDNVLGIGYESGVQQVWSTQSVLFADVLNRINGGGADDENNDEDYDENENENEEKKSKKVVEQKAPVFFMDDSDQEDDDASPSPASTSSPSGSPTSRGPTGSRHSRMYTKRLMRKTEALHSAEGRNEVLGAAASSSSSQKKRQRDEDNSNSDNDNNDNSDGGDASDSGSTKKSKKNTSSSSSSKPIKEYAATSLNSTILQRVMVRVPKHEPKPSEDAAVVQVTKPDPRPPRCTDTPFLA